MDSHLLSPVLRKRKLYNCIGSFITFALGITAVLYKFRYEADMLFGGDLALGALSSLREMTVCDSLTASFVALACAILNLRELKTNRIILSRFWYYIRLSVCVTEAVIFAVVMIGFLPFFPDRPNITRFDCMQMHLTVPLLSILSFILHDAPIGKLKPMQLLNGMMIIFIYAAVMLSLVGFGILPDERAPYSFLRIHEISIAYMTFAVWAITSIGFGCSTLFYLLNLKAAKRDKKQAAPASISESH